MVVDLLDCWKGRFGNYHNRSIWEAIPSCIMQCVRSWREKCLMLWKLWVLGFGFENGGKCGTKDIMTIATMGFLFITYLKYKILLRFLNLYLFFSVGISHVYFLCTWVSLSTYLIKLFYIKKRTNKILIYLEWSENILRCFELKEWMVNIFKMTI